MAKLWKEQSDFNMNLPTFFSYLYLNTQYHSFLVWTSCKNNAAREAPLINLVFFYIFFGRKDSKKGSDASNGSDKQKRINQLLNASHNSQGR